MSDDKKKSKDSLNKNNSFDYSDENKSASTSNKNEASASSDEKKSSSIANKNKSSASPDNNKAEDSSKQKKSSGSATKKAMPTIVFTVITVLLLLYVVWRLDTAPRTDDAYVYADTIEVVAQVRGKIINLPVKNNQALKKGDILFEIDPRPYQDALNQARASLNQLNQQIALTQRSVNAQKYNAGAAQANVKKARAAANQAADTLRRMEPLLEPAYVSAEQVDIARSNYRASQATLEAALLEAKGAVAGISGVDALIAQRGVIEAQIASAKLNLEFTTVRAPFDSRVVSLATAVGHYATPAQAVFTLIDTRQWYVVANFREAELKNIHPDTASTVYLMTNSDEEFEGRVDSIGYGVHPDDGGTVVGGLPLVKRTINWVRVAQRFPVKVLIDNPDPDLFRINASAVVVLHPERKDSERQKSQSEKRQRENSKHQKLDLQKLDRQNSQGQQLEPEQPLESIQPETQQPESIKLETRRPEPTEIERQQQQLKAKQKLGEKQP